MAAERSGPFVLIALRELSLSVGSSGQDAAGWFILRGLAAGPDRRCSLLHTVHDRIAQTATERKRINLSIWRGHESRRN